MTKNNERLPLSHITVLDLTTIIAGPFCTLHLAHMGANVIKVEPLGVGDSGRNLGSDADLNDAYMGSLFLGMNGGKQSLTLNLKTEQGIDIFKQLVAQSDVVVENFRAGVMDKLGLGYKTLKAINPSIVYCAISGYGQQGPMSKRAAYDQIIQGVSGMMATTGEPPTANTPPTPYRVGVPISDTVTGLTAAFAISSALNDPHKDGAYLDISMLEATIISMGWAVSNYTISGRIPEQVGNHSSISSPSGAFRTSDGMINIATNTQEQWQNLATCLGHPEWLNMDIFKDRKSRYNNRQQLIALIEEALSKNTTAHWIEKIAPLKIPVGEILTLDKTLALPQIQARGLLQTTTIDGIENPVQLAKPAVHINNRNPNLKTPPEPLSHSTDKVLKDMLGLDDKTLAQLRDNKVI